MSSTMGPDQSDVLAELGQVNVQLKKYAVAEKQLDRAAALDADNYAANFGLLQLYVQTGDPRRDDQSKRFEEIKQKREEELKNTLQSLEIRPGDTP
jgi:Tfp pilus assembly protein PilF